MASTIDNSQDVIDSRDVIERIEELESERDSLEGAELSAWLESDDGNELIALKKLADDAEQTPDWIHGETLIRESYFTDYIRDLIHNCYKIPKEFDSGEWPWNHITFDYEAAANEAKVDYFEAEFDGVTYLVRA